MIKIFNCCIFIKPNKVYSNSNLEFHRSNIFNISTTKLNEQFHFRLYNEVNKIYKYSINDFDFNSINDLDNMIIIYNNNMIKLNEEFNIVKYNYDYKKEFHYMIIYNISNYYVLSKHDIEKLKKMLIEEKIFICIHYKKIFNFLSMCLIKSN